MHFLAGKFSSRLYLHHCSCRATVGSGVLGGAAADGPRFARMDLCCTAHVTPGVRRLLKSVVRGLKVRRGGRVDCLLWGCYLTGSALACCVCCTVLCSLLPRSVHHQSHLGRLVCCFHTTQACQEPERVKEGMGGSYLCYNEAGRKVAILKPCDEEPLAPNNPKGYVGRNLGDPGWRATVRVGEVRAPTQQSGMLLPCSQLS